MHETSVAGVQDMAELGDLHEAAILYNIYQRYTKDVIYVRTKQPGNIVNLVRALFLLSIS